MTAEDLGKIVKGSERTMSMELSGLGNSYEYNMLMNLTNVSVSKHLLDDEFTLVWANESYYGLIKYPKEEYERIFHNSPRLFYGDHPSLWNEIGERVTTALTKGENGYKLVTKMPVKGGEYVWVKITAQFTDEYVGGKRIAYTVMSDITDVMEMQREQALTYDSLPGFVAKFLITDGEDMTLLSANDKYYAFFGDASMRNISNPIYCENMKRNKKILTENKEAFIKGDSVHFIVTMKNKDGKEFWLQINASCVDWVNNEPVYVIIYLDITDETELRQMQVNLQNALNAAETANHAKSEFLSNMSHDIRTPMNAIIGMTDIARAHLDDTEKVKSCLNKISLSSKHLLGLINDVLDMSKIEIGKMTLREDIISLPELMENVVMIIQPQLKAKSQAFRIRLKDVTHEQFISDQLRISQVFLNILSNACKFTPDGGTITIDVTETPIENAADGKTSMMSFVFTDTGIGMTEEFLAHIFDAFTRERDSRVDKIEGTGLGMAITKNIVQLFGGTIEVKSKVGAGTSFKVEIPMRPDQTPQLEMSCDGLRVVVCDDDEVMCECMEAMLHKLNVRAFTTTDGEMAINEIARAYKNNEPYDAAMLDWKMPKQDGLAVSKQLNALYGDSLPIVVVSAYDWDDIEETAKKVGVKAMLNKPLFMSTLYSCLQRYVLGSSESFAAKEGRQKFSFSGKRFLLVEDNLINQEVVVEMLGDTDAEIDIAENGMEGVKRFEASEENYYDIIFMDIQMPVMNGYDAARAIRALERKDAATVPIIAMTADAFSEDVAAAKEAGMNGHMTKPLDEKLLKQDIEKYLGIRIIGQS